VKVDGAVVPGDIAVEPEVGVLVVAEADSAEEKGPAAGAVFGDELVGDDGTGVDAGEVLPGVVVEAVCFCVDFLVAKAGDDAQFCPDPENIFGKEGKVMVWEGVTGIAK